VSSRQYPIFFFFWRYWITDYCCWRVSLLPVQNMTVMSFIWTRNLALPVHSKSCLPYIGVLDSHNGVRSTTWRCLCSCSTPSHILEKKTQYCSEKIIRQHLNWNCTYMQLHSYSWLFLWVRAAPVFLQTEPWFLLDVQSTNQEHCRSKRGRWEKIGSCFRFEPWPWGIKLETQLVADLHRQTYNF
jgi:hypothetical protein